MTIYNKGDLKLLRKKFETHGCKVRMDGNNYTFYSYDKKYFMVLKESTKAGLTQVYEQVLRCGELVWTSANWGKILGDLDLYFSL